MIDEVLGDLSMERSIVGTSSELLRENREYCWTSTELKKRGSEDHTSDWWRAKQSFLICVVKKLHWRHSALRLWWNQLRLKHKKHERRGLPLDLVFSKTKKNSIRIRVHLIVSIEITRVHIVWSLSWKPRKFAVCTKIQMVKNVLQAYVRKCMSWLL